MNLYSVCETEHFCAFQHAVMQNQVVENIKNIYVQYAKWHYATKWSYVK